MDIGLVTGTIVSTIRNEAMSRDSALLLVELEGGQREVVVDTVRAGIGDRVLVAHGTAARLAIGDERSTIDAAITAIVDAIDAGAET